MLKRPSFFSASWLRTLIEVVILSTVLFFLLPQIPAKTIGDELPAATMFMIICCAFWGTARLQWQTERRMEVAMIAGMGTAVSIGILPAIFLLGKWPIRVEGDAGLGNMLIIFVLTSFVYLNMRITFWFWVQWNVMRKKRLLWSFTHIQIILAFMAISVLVIATESAAILQNWQGEPLIPLFFSYALNVFVEILPIFSVLAISTLFFGVIFALPLMFVSFLLTRNTIGRVEDLAKGTAELRAGDLTTRVTVTGEDEVAQLQDNFNQMAADLEKTVAELEQERDRVAGLLKVQHELTASVSHELRTPIATIQGYLQPAIERLSDSTDAATQKDLEIIAGKQNACVN